MTLVLIGKDLLLEENKGQMGPGTYVYMIRIKKNTFTFKDEKSL